MRPAQRRLVRRSVERRNLHSLCQLLGSLGGGKCLDDGAELVAYPLREEMEIFREN